MNEDLDEVVARCLAKLDGKFISATDWHGAIGAEYRHRARQVFRTIERWESGVRSGGLPKTER